MRVVHVAPLESRRWVVSLDVDAAPPVSEHGSRAEAETAARAYATTFGYPEVVVHGLNGEETHMLLDPQPQPPYPGAAKGEASA